MDTNQYIIRIATSKDYKYAQRIADEMSFSALERGIPIEYRNKDYIRSKMEDGLLVIAIDPQNQEWIGSSYLETWKHKKYIANSGLIVSKQYRNKGVALQIKERLFELARTKFPFAKIFSFTTNMAVMHSNEMLGYKVIPYTRLLADRWFLKGCEGKVDFVELMKNQIGRPHHVAMVYTPDTIFPTPSISTMEQHFLERLDLVGNTRLQKIHFAVL